MRWATLLAALTGAALIAASILFIGRWQITAVDSGYKGDYADAVTVQNIYRLDRWTGSISYCVVGYSSEAPTAADVVKRYAQTGKIPAGSLNCTELK